MDFKFYEVQSLKEEIYNTLTSMEATTDDDMMCQKMTSIADNLEKIVLLVKKDKVLSRTPVVVNSLKDIRDFSEKLSAIIRGRSWFALCPGFNPNLTMENIKTLKSILTKSLKPEKKEKAPKTVQTFVDEDDGAGLMDDDDWNRYNIRVSHNKNKVQDKTKIGLMDKKLQRAIEQRDRNRY